MLLAVSSLRAESDWRPCSSSCSIAEVVHPLHVLVGEDVVGLDEHAELGRRADLVLERVDVGDGLGRLVDPCERVGLQLELVLDGDAAGEDRRRWRRASGTAHAWGSEPSLTVRRPSTPSRKSRPVRRRAELADAEGGERHDDRVEADDGDADGEEQAEVADHRHLGEAQGEEGEDGVERDDEESRAEVARRLLDRVVGAIEDHLLLDAGVQLDGVVDPDAEHHGQPGDRHDRQRDAEVAGEPERPHDADEDHGERQQAPSDVEEHEQDQRHDRHGDAAEHEHPAAQVVVDVVEEDRRTGGGDGGVRERELVHALLRRHGERALVVDRQVAGEAHDDRRVALVVEERPLRAADRPGVVEQQEVDPVGVVERALVGGDRAGAFERARRVGLARRRLVAAGLGGGEGAQRDRSGDAARRVAARRVRPGRGCRCTASTVSGVTTDT